MVFLTSISSSELSDFKERYRNAGIPVYIEPDYSNRDNTVTGSATAYLYSNTSPNLFRVYVCLDNQIIDAKCLLTDKSHTVNNPVNVTEFEEEMTRLGANKNVEWRPSDATLNKIAIFFMIGFILWILYAILTS